METTAGPVIRYSLGCAVHGARPSRRRVPAWRQPVGAPRVGVAIASRVPGCHAVVRLLFSPGGPARAGDTFGGTSGPRMPGSRARRARREGRGRAGPPRGRRRTPGEQIGSGRGPAADFDLHPAPGPAPPSGRRPTSTRSRSACGPTASPTGVSPADGLSGSSCPAGRRLDFDRFLTVGRVGERRREHVVHRPGVAHAEAARQSVEEALRDVRLQAGRRSPGAAGSSRCAPISTTPVAWRRYWPEFDGGRRSRVYGMVDVPTTGGSVRLVHGEVCRRRASGLVDACPLWTPFTFQRSRSLVTATPAVQPARTGLMP